MRQDVTASMLLQKAGEGARRFFANLPGADLRHVPEGFLMITGEPIADLNGGFVDEGPNAEAVLREWVTSIRARGYGGFVSITSSAGPRLAPVARTLGLQEVGPNPLMANQPASIPVTTETYRIQTVKDRYQIEIFTDLMSRGFGLPLEIWRRLVTTETLKDLATTNWIAFAGEEPYSAATTMETEGSVGIWNMATPPEYQRRGAGRALLSHILRSQMLEGRRLFYLIASEAGKHLYEQVGFRTVDEGTLWLIGA